MPTYTGPSGFGYFFFLHVVLVCFFWPAVGYALYRTLPWLFGPEAAAAWTGRRRVKLLAGAFGVAMAACLTLFMLDGPGRFVEGVFTVNVVQFIDWYADAQNADGFMHGVLGAGLFELAVTLIVLMGVRIYECAANGRASEAERATGWRGVRAWQTWPKLFWAAAVVLTATGFAAGLRFATDFVTATFGLSLLGTLAVLVSTPVLRTLRAAADRDAATFVDRPNGGADLSPERQRVMRLLEDGRVTADEAAELLTALAATATPIAEAARGPVPLWHKLILAGAAMVLVGFFLPWFRINPYAQMQRAMGTAFGAPNASLAIHQTLPGQTLGLSQNLSRITVNGVETPWPRFGEPLERATVSVTGGDVGRGFGWVVLATALAAAAVPAVATGLSRTARRQTLWLMTAAGGVIVLYLLTSNPAAASYGLVLAALGETMIVGGLVAELPRREPRAAGVVLAG